MAANSAGNSSSIAWLVCDDLFEDSLRLRVVILRNEGFGLFQSEVYRGRTRLSSQPIDESFDLTFGLGANETIHWLAIFKGKDRRYRLHLQLRCYFLVLIHVNFNEFDRAVSSCHRFLYLRAKLFAGFAPRCPKVYHHGCLAGCFDYISNKICCVAVLYNAVRYSLTTYNGFHMNVLRGS